MYLVFNEVSETPLAENINQAEERIKLFIQTFKAAKEKGFEYIRFQDLAQLNLTDNLNFALWIANTNSSKNRELREFFWSSFIRKPYIPEGDEKQENEYGNHLYFLEINGKEVYCNGLAIAYIYNTLGISFYSSEWTYIEQSIIVKDENEQNIKNEKVYQIARPEHLSDPLLFIFKRLFLIKNLSKIKDLEELYPTYQFKNKVIDEILDWKQENNDTYQKLHRLLADIEEHPFTGGLGKTEALKHNDDGLNSKRLTRADRIVYSLKNSIITVFSCKGHYGDK